MTVDTLAPPVQVDRRAADLVERFLARLTDWTALYVVLSLLLLFTSRPIAALVFSGISLAYYLGLEVLAGRTLGKRLMRLRVETPDGARPSAAQALRRHLADLWPVAFAVPAAGAWLGPLAALAAAAAALAAGAAIHRHPGRGAWPDRLSGTQVVGQAEESRAQVQA